MQSWDPSLTKPFNSWKERMEIENSIRQKIIEQPRSIKKHRPALKSASPTPSSTGHHARSFHRGT